MCCRIEENLLTYRQGLKIPNTNVLEYETRVTFLTIGDGLVLSGTVIHKWKIISPINLRLNLHLHGQWWINTRSWLSLLECKKDSNMIYTTIVQLSRRCLRKNHMYTFFRASEETNNSSHIVYPCFLASRNPTQNSLISIAAAQFFVSSERSPRRKQQEESVLPFLDHEALSTNFPIKHFAVFQSKVAKR